MNTGEMVATELASSGYDFGGPTSTVAMVDAGNAKYRMTALTAWPRPTRYAPRSQAFSPSPGSDPGSPHKPRHRREPAPVEPAAAAARCRVSPDPHRLARPLTARSRPRLRPRHSRPRDPGVSPPEHPSLECPTPTAVPR